MFYEDRSVIFAGFIGQDIELENTNYTGREAAEINKQTCLIVGHVCTQTL